MQSRAHGRSRRDPPRHGRASASVRKVTAYVALTKPRVIELLLVTTAPVMVLAAGRHPEPLARRSATLVGGTLSAGSANAFNCYIDRDIDRVMKRTQNAPARHRRAERPRGARLRLDHRRRCRSLWLGSSRSTWLAAALSLVAILFYVFVYTLLLKRRTPQNIVWGGAAGCMPVLIGWAAVTGSLDWAPVILFGIVFLWTPPHYWPLSMRYRDDYAVGRRADARRRARPRHRRPAGRPLRLGDRRVLAAAHPGRAHGRALHGRRAAAGGWFSVESHRSVLTGHPQVAEVRPMRVFHARSPT